VCASGSCRRLGSVLELGATCQRLATIACVYPLDVLSAVAVFLEEADAVISSFDSPICDLTRVLRARGVADVLRQNLVEHGVHVPADLVHEQDPYLVHRYAFACDNNTGRMSRCRSHSDYLLYCAEGDAMATLQPVPGAREAITRVTASGRRWAIASDCAQEPMQRWVDDRQLAEVGKPIGRYSFAPMHWKPSPWSLRMAAALAEVPVDRCLFIGTTVADVQMAVAAGIPVITAAGAQPRARPEELRAAGARFVLGQAGMTIVAEAAATLTRTAAPAH
jgi:phosphoglycolate phosphatase